MPTELDTANRRLLTELETASEVLGQLSGASALDLATTLRPVLADYRLSVEVLTLAARHRRLVATHQALTTTAAP